MSVTVEGVGTGAIPDSPPGGLLCGDPGPPLDISFDVDGIDGALADVEVTITGAHPWIGDLDVTLLAPDGTAHLLFSRLGAQEIYPGSGHLDCGSGAELDGTYTFTDRAPATPAFGEAAAATRPRTAVRTGAYRSSTVGGRQVTAITPVFATVADLRGRWTLRVCDVGFEFAGVITAARLTLTTVDVPLLTRRRSTAAPRRERR